MRQFMGDTDQRDNITVVALRINLCTAATKGTLADGPFSVLCSSTVERTPRERQAPDYSIGERPFDAAVH